jgi:hypothetical protein
MKYGFLNDNSMTSVEWKKLEYREPYYFFVFKDLELEKKYENGFAIITPPINNPNNAIISYGKNRCT